MTKATGSKANRIRVPGIRLAFFWFVLLAAASCEDSLPPAPIPGFSSVAVPAPAQSPSSSDWQKKLQDMRLLEEIRRPYTLRCCYAFLNTLEAPVLGAHFENRMKAHFSHAPGSIRLELSASLERSEELIRASRPEQLSAAFYREAKECDLIAAVVASVTDRTIQVRALHSGTRRPSALISDRFEYPVEVGARAVDAIREIAGWEGYVFEVREDGVEIVFRGVARELDRLGCSMGERYFWCAQGNRRVRDCLIRVVSTSERENFLVGRGQYMGLGNPSAGGKVIQAHLPGGSQRFRLIDERGRKQAALSIFAAYRGFSVAAEDYLTTTDLSGEFVLSDAEKKPVHVVVARNVEGVDLAFVRKLLVVDPEEGIGEIRVIDFSGEGSEVDWTSEQIEFVESQVPGYLLQAQEYIRGGRFKEAVVSLQVARRLVERIPESQRNSGLSASLEKAQAAHQRSWDQKRAQEEYSLALQYLQAADEAVRARDYGQAQNKLGLVRKIWPQEFYAVEFEEVVKREKGLSVLREQENEPVGKARRFLSEELLLWKAEELDGQKIGQLEDWMDILHEKGQKSQDIYNDLELWTRLRVFLDSLSQELSRKARHYEEEYHRADQPDRREELYRLHDVYHRQSRTIDHLLEKFR